MSWGRRGRRVACATSLFKRKALVGLALTVGAALFTPSATAAQAPDEQWRTLRTEHFRVTFPARLETLGRKAADRAEWAWTQLAEHFIDPPDGMIDMVVTDHIDVSNGFAQVTPSNRMTVYARPPVDALALGHLDEWLELVITHELAHIVQLDYVSNPIGRVARTVFGRVSAEWPFFPGLGTPRWVTEGMATWYESRLTGAGRVRGTFQEMQIRTALLEDRFESIGQASGESPLWPGGNRPYAYGSSFFDYLLERHGEEKMAAFAEAIAGQWIPYRIDAAGRSAFGVSLSSEWTAWETQLRRDLEGLDARLASQGPITESERLTEGARWGLHPTPSPDGRWVAFTRSDGRSDIQLRVREVETGEERSLGRTNGLSTFAWTPDNRIVVSQLEFDDPYRAYADLWIFDLEGGQRRLTHQARLTQPGVDGAGGLIAVQEGDGTNALVRVDPETGAVSPFVAPDPEVHWAFPRPSPDGRWIAATRWEPNANHDVVILDGRTGRVASLVTTDRALDMGPAWTPDGSSIVWASDRTGILNILGATIDPATGQASDVRMVTNVRTGVAYPAVSPDGAWLYFSGHHVDGWDVERVPFAGVTGPNAPGADARFQVAPTRVDRGLADGTVESYSVWPTLGPRFWEIATRDAVVTPRVEGGGLVLRSRELLGPSIGAQTAGRDLVGRHSWSAIARLSTTGRKVGGAASYSFWGLGNPVLSLSTTQRHVDGGQQVAGTALDTLFVLQRERTLDASVSMLAPTWRRNLVFTVGAGLVWEKRELLNVRLQPSSSYNLSRPNSRLASLTGTISYNSSRSHSFQMGTARGLNAFVQGRVRTELALPDSLVSVAGVDRSLGEVVGRVRGGIPLWGGGFARHTLAVQLIGATASGPGAGALQYRVGGASGQVEDVTGLELFGGNFVLFPVRGYPMSSRFGRHAWSGSLEYRFPLLLINRGLRAWPIHLDRTVGTLFVDGGNAWGPDITPGGFQNGLRQALASGGAEVTTEFLALYDVQLRVRVGVAVPFIEGGGAIGYVRVGLPF